MINMKDLIKQQNQEVRKKTGMIKEDAINEVGASAADMVAILEALREAGSLRAELIII